MVKFFPVDRYSNGRKNYRYVIQMVVLMIDTGQTFNSSNLVCVAVKLLQITKLVQVIPSAEQNHLKHIYKK